ncbi:ABC transporter permease [Phaeacidiphilus oryzae]|uniref:ABC transporter permease n=1 Tax=Phaeacidiphilus oryzae TaxID=348818 RepID=UPI00068975A8|nr:ABC transporter permease [Phaeacidiphilus oryzae]
MTDAAHRTVPAGPAPGGSLAWARRRAATARFWQAYRADRAGLAGLALLLLFVGAAVLAPVLTGGPQAVSIIDAPGTPLQPPGAGYPLGTDGYGRSELALLLWGARISLTVGFLATFLSMAIGAVLGILAGHFGGWPATVLMRITDWFLVLPTLVLAVALASVLSPGTATIVLAIGVTTWPRTARLVRAQTLAVEGRPYIERSRALGGGHRHVMARHVLPNVMPLVLAQTTLTVANAILTESTLAFLGLGDPGTVSWGGLLQDARQAGAVSAGDWWTLLPPGLAIAAVALSFTLCGRAMESALNPRLRGGR